MSIIDVAKTADEFKINALRDIELYECIYNGCGNKFKGSPVDYIKR